MSDTEPHAVEVDHAGARMRVARLAEVAALVLAIGAATALAAYVARELGSDWNDEYLPAWKRPFAAGDSPTAAQGVLLASLLLVVAQLNSVFGRVGRAASVGVAVTAAANLSLSIGHWAVLLTVGDQVRDRMALPQLGGPWFFVQDFASALLVAVGFGLAVSLLDWKLPRLRSRNTVAVAAVPFIALGLGGYAWQTADNKEATATDAACVVIRFAPTTSAETVMAFWEGMTAGDPEADSNVEESEILLRFKSAVAADRFRRGALVASAGPVERITETSCARFG